MHQTGLGAVLERPSLPPSRRKTNPSHHTNPPLASISNNHVPPSMKLGSGNSFRKLLLLTVLSTDMGVHDDFMNNFNKLILRTQNGPVDDLDDFDTRVLVCQALIKCADISNPVIFNTCFTLHPSHLFI